MSGSGSRRSAAGAAAFSSAAFGRDRQAEDSPSLREHLGQRRSFQTSDREQLDGQTGSATEEAQRLGGYTMIAPNLTRRNQLLQNANKELEDLAKLREQRRAALITLTPRRLGGETSEAEVRQKQQLEHIQSKYQQKLKKDEYQRIKREAEEAEIMKKKMIQREKANKLEEKQRKQEWERQQMFAGDHYLKNTELLNKLGLPPSSGTSCKPNRCNPESTTWARSHSHKAMQREEENRKLQEMRDAQRRKAELLELKYRQEEKIRTKAHQNNQQRVNDTFLDKLQNNHQLGDTYQSGCLGNLDFSTDSWEFEYEQ